MSRILRLAGWGLLLLTLCVGVALAAANYEVPWSVISSGGGRDQQGSLTLDSSIGQPIVGVGSADRTSLGAGYMDSAMVDYRAILPLVLKSS